MPVACCTEKFQRRPLPLQYRAWMKISDTSQLFGTEISKSCAMGCSSLLQRYMSYQRYVAGLYARLAMSRCRGDISFLFWQLRNRLISDIFLVSNALQHCCIGFPRVQLKCLHFLSSYLGSHKLSRYLSDTTVGVWAYALVSLC